MNKPENFEILKSHAVYRPTGCVSLQQAVQLVTVAVVFARENEVRKLLVNGTQLTGFESPSVARRYFIMQEWAQAAQGKVCVSMVIKQEMIDPHKFGVMVGENFGLRSNVFALEDEALAWLQSVS